jgi:hypothetical protein
MLKATGGCKLLRLRTADPGFGTGLLADRRQQECSEGNQHRQSFAHPRERRARVFGRPQVFDVRHIRGDAFLAGLTWGEGASPAGVAAYEPGRSVKAEFLLYVDLGFRRRFPL